MEHQTVAVIAGYFDRLRQVILVSEEKQRNPFHIDTDFDFGRTDGTSLMARLVRTGVPVCQLLEQYRTHPDIADTISHEIHRHTCRMFSSMQRRPE